MTYAKFLREHKNLRRSGSPVLSGLAIVKCNEADYCWWQHTGLDWYISRFFKIGQQWKEQRDHYFAVAKLYQRWQRFKNYMTEARHNWQKVRDIHYADNSIEVVERSSLTGEERQRMTLAPGGDVCY